MASSSTATTTADTNTASSSFQAWRVDKIEATKDGGNDNKPTFVGTEQTMSIESLTPLKNDTEEGILIHVTHSSLNYKDALSAAGNKGVTRTFPHTPGIDAAGIRIDTGTPVLVTGYDLGMNTNGGYGERILVPSKWIVEPQPFEDARTSMIYGTAGLTAGLCVQKLLAQGKATPSDGTVCVTGATGSVGSVAVELLSQLGFDVVAVSGKPDQHSKLLDLGATKVVERDALEAGPKPLLKPEYAHGIDTVGGTPLAELLKRIQNGGSVACCGNAAGMDLPTSVLPFILRGVQLLGVDSVEIPLEEKRQVWTKLATVWKCPKTEAAAKDIGRHELDACLKAYLKGESAGKIVLDHSKTPPTGSKL